ncbi:MAG: pyridine nucleotide-disulfide oxidoreductase [Candidatus Cloacimonadota bacterium]|nr:MAG: pyridine nucleotide-disulfide oxidoreductase [Candidatus Cloacimonadota bacterium]
MKYDLIVIGLGPAGMAVSAMGTAMGLKVLGIEDHKVGGECLNYGCIPSKALLKAGEANHMISELEKFGIEFEGKTKVINPLEIVREKVNRIAGPKTMKMFDKVDMVIGKGKAEFLNKRVIKAGNKKYRGKHIFIASGTEPFLPPIPGLKDVPDSQKLTNMNIFHQKDAPESLMVIGGGAIGVEMAQAFSKLGSKVILAQMDEHLMPLGDADAAKVLEEKFAEEGIEVYNSTKIKEIKYVDGKIITCTDKGDFTSEKILVATGRKPVLEPLKLDNAGIKYDSKGIKVNKFLQTNVKNIYAIGDCNGIALLSHAAMHQGMLALMNAINPFPFGKMRYDKYIVPWSVFTKPEIAQAGLTEKEALAKGLKFETVIDKFGNYGRLIADGHPEGFIKVLIAKSGKIYGVTIVGEQASELIHEWILAIQKGIKIWDIMLTQHSFPTISLMNKRVAEQWAMGKMKSSLLQKIIKFVV